MAKIKLTKNELRGQQTRLEQLRRYLPTLQLKKTLLQAEVSDARTEMAEFQRQFLEKKNIVLNFSQLLTAPFSIELKEFANIVSIEKRYDNIAGIELPSFIRAVFPTVSYSLFDTPAWTESAIEQVQKMMEAKATLSISQEKLTVLEHELREVSIRVNLFEKVLIPRALADIKKIKIFLADQQLAAVSQAKVAKSKIQERKHFHELMVKESI